MNHHGGILPGDDPSLFQRHIIKEDQRPTIPTSRANVDIPLFDVVRPGPRDWQVTEQTIRLPEHGPIGPTDGQIGTVYTRLCPSIKHRDGMV